MNRATDDLISRTEAKDFVRSERGAELLKHFPLSAIIVLKLLDEVPAAQEPAMIEPKRIELADETKGWMDKMDDREKVIRGLEFCTYDGTDYLDCEYNCPYADKYKGLENTCVDALMRDAFALLKAQEPVIHGRWETIDDCGITRCSACKWNFEGYIDYNYCPNCGAKMETKNE